MNSRETVFLNNTLRNKNRVLKVVAIPRHERNSHILTKRQLAHVNGRTIRHHITTSDLLALTDQRLLVDTGVLVGTDVLSQVVDIDASITCLNLVVVYTNNNTTRINTLDYAATFSDNTHTRVLRNDSLDTSTYNRLFRSQCRHSLTLHVRTHQCTVRVIMLQERNQGCSNRYNLTRTYVHIIYLFRRHYSRFVSMTNGYQLFC